MRALVTGTSGFVGSAIASALRARGWEVHGLNRSASRPGSVDVHHTADLRDELPALPRVDAVVHCAGMAAPWGRRRDFLAVNVGGTRRLVRWAESHGQPHFVYVSSTSVHYEGRDQYGLHEDSPLPRPINHYAESKQQSERVVRSYAGPSAILRPRAAYGPGDTQLFPRILELGARGQLPKLVREDGVRASGDVIYVENLTHYAATVLEKSATGTFILTDGTPVVIQDFLEQMLRGAGHPPPTREVPVRRAMRLARIAELVSMALLGYREPPITRFGITVFAYSKTFDVRKCTRELGPPPFTTEQGASRFLEWWRRQNA